MSLRAMKSFLMGRQFVINTDNWSVLIGWRGQTQKDAVIRRLEEFMHWYPDVQFIAGKDNGIADYLSRFPLQKDEVMKHAIPREVRCCPIQVHDVGVFYEGEQCLVHIWRYFHGHQWDTSVTTYFKKALEREVRHYVLRDGCLMRMLRSRCVRVVMGSDKKDLLHVYPDSYGHCGTKTLLKQLLQQYWWPIIGKDYTLWVKSCPICQQFGRPSAHAHLCPIQANYLPPTCCY